MSTYRILLGDVRETIKAIPDCSVQCVITSPPYWGLRDYGTAKWDGGDPECTHEARAQQRGTFDGGMPASLRDKPRNECRCGAARVDSQLGLESTPEEYVARMVDVFREVRRVLRDDGVLWLNLGDSYIGQNNTDVGGNGNWGSKNGAGLQVASTVKGAWRGLAPKNLVGIPWRVAFALQADGWYLRSDVIWSKPNPMPESVTDRPTKAHEYVFLLSKSERYFYDAGAIAEPFADERKGNPGKYSRTPQSSKGANNDRQDTGFLNNGAGWNADGGRENRNARTVWNIATQPFSGAHFATFPPELAQRCILAGSRAGDTVLDPFAGSGTTGMVATGHGRDAILCELNPEYADLIRERCGVLLEVA